MKLLFLDIDGVLNTHDIRHRVGSCSIHPDKVKILNRVIDSTNCKLVLTSAWRWLVHRKEMTLRGFDWLMRSHGLYADSIHGITRMESVGNPNDDRGYLIIEYLRDHTPKKYCVVDDLDLSITVCGHPFVKTNSEVGLLDDHADRIIAILNS